MSPPSEPTQCRKGVARREFLAAAATGVAGILGSRPLAALGAPPAWRAQRSLNMAVIGDSIVWGQGLSETDKFWFKTKNWLGQTLMRPVSHQLYAHSGARIQPYAWLDAKPPMYGEIPSAYPSIVAQANMIQNPGDVDFVLLDGGSNDVGLGEALKPSVTADQIRDAMPAKCRERMHGMLCYLVGRFPNARFIVTSYYPLFSQQSFSAPNVLVAIFSSAAFGMSESVATKYIADRDVLIGKANAFADGTSQALQEAVDAINNDFGRRVALAKVAIGGDRCLAAPDSHIYGLEVDPPRAQRIAQCALSGQFSFVDFGRMNVSSTFELSDAAICPIANLFHPNPKGAQRYFEAITAVLPQFLPRWSA